MKNLLPLLFSCLFLAQNLRAQLADGSVAPDFTATDINGVTYNLYDILEQGKTVVIDVSATWCGPCWFYHNTHALEQVWNEWGPAGTNEIMVFFIEGDPSTNLACLHGDETNCSTATQGDWVTNTKYPIIDDANIADAYQINYFPTIYAICPNKRVRELGQVFPQSFKDFADACPVEFGVNNSGIVSYETGMHTDFFCDAAKLSPKISFQNLGSANMTSAKISVQVNGTAVQTKTWTGNLGLFDFGTLQFDPMEYPTNDLIEVGLSIDEVNGVADDNALDNYESIVALPTTDLIEQNLVKFEFRADNDGPESHWQLIGPSGQILYSGGNPAAQPGAHTPNLTGGYYANQFIKDTFFLPGPGCYEFRLIDDGGNGLNNSGYFKITSMDGQTVLAESQPFADVISDWFKAENIAVSADPISLIPGSTVFAVPNPATDRLSVRWENLDFEPSRLVLTDVSGKEIRTFNIAQRAGNQEFSLDAFANGTYFARVSGEGKSIVQKVSVLR